MFHKFDDCGWYTGSQDTPDDRTTDIGPPNTSTSEVEGDPRSNYTGYEWMEIPYRAPIGPTRDELKAQRQAKVDAIVVTVNSKAFDGDEISQGRMARALRVADITGQTSCTWVLHDNTSAVVTKDELAQALALAMQAQADVWVIPA